MQKLRFSRYFKGIIILIDLLAITGVFTLYFFSRNRDLQIHQVDWEQTLLTHAILLFFWILLSGSTKLYDIPRNLTFTIFVERLLKQILFFLVGLILLAKISSNEFLKTERFVLAIALFVVLFVLKSSIFFLVRSVRSLGINHRNIMFLGHNTTSRSILENTLAERRDFGYKIYDYSAEETDIDQLKSFWEKMGIHTLFLPASGSGIDEHTLASIFQEAQRSKVKVTLIPEFIQDDFFEYELSYLETQPLLVSAKFPLDYFSNYFIKRIFDILFSLLVLIFIASWLFPIIALVIKLNSSGPVFFKQRRYGYHDEVFNCLKFRTMRPNDSSSTKTTEENDTRITGFGRFLRRTSLDEMPQFINVLKGEMSVVGPRPHMLLVDDYYKPRIGRYSVRSLVKPGITGLAQVKGLRGDMGDMKIEMKKRVLADAFYVKNWSLVLDLTIILRTVGILLTGDKKAR